MKQLGRNRGYEHESLFGYVNQREQLVFRADVLVPKLVCHLSGTAKGPPRIVGQRVHVTGQSSAELARRPACGCDQCHGSSSFLLATEGD